MEDDTLVTTQHGIPTMIRFGKRQCRVLMPRETITLRMFHSASIVLLVFLATSSALHLPSTASRASEFLHRFNQAAALNPRSIDALTTTQLTYIKCVGTQRKYPEVKRKVDFSTDVFSWKRIGYLVDATAYGSDITILSVRFGERTLEFTLANRNMLVQVAKEKGC